MMHEHVYAIVKACEDAGVSHVVICPGSRSAPLVYAFTRSSIACHSIVDERSAAYIALGMAQQLKKPVALVCTSGTAALNFFPAIAEAYYQQIPLLVLTADRPPELLNQQDGQMINQQAVYGSHVLSFQQLAFSPQEKAAAKIAYHQTSEAIRHGTGLRKGPVHINIPLREPLYPAANEKVPNLSFAYKPALRKEHSLPSFSKEWSQATKKLVLVGQYPTDGSLNGALQELSRHPDVVIVADVLSNVHEFNTCKQFDTLVLKADAESLAAMTPDLVVSLGGPVLSKSLKLWFQQLKPAVHIRFNSSEKVQVDTYRNVTHHVTGDPAPWLFQKGLEPHRQSSYADFWRIAGNLVHQQSLDFIQKHPQAELSFMHTILGLIPDAASVQLGNSSIIRYASYVGINNPSLTLHGNRGTSGIDGCSSTAVGAALVNNRPNYLISGDVAFLYDINAWWNMPPSNLKVIVFNNEGGGIFELIEGPDKHPRELPFFTTPHQQSIKQIALQKGFEHYLCTSATQLKTLKKFWDPTTGPALLEVKVDRNQNAKAFHVFKNYKV